MKRRPYILLNVLAATWVVSCAPATPSARGAVASGQYRNLFVEYLGKSPAEVDARIEAAWQHLFYGDDATERVYYPVGADRAYILDVGNDDVRSEGMSYGMMIAVQRDHKDEFDRLWTWAKAYMYQPDGPYAGYFAWHCTTDGEQIDANPASDGEAWFATALFLASARWGDGDGRLDYRAEAQAILDTMLHKEDSESGIGTNMFDAETHQIVFVPRLGPVSQHTDPSYHVPAYYELWARWATRDNAFWSEAAQASRAFFKAAAHPATGLMPDYAHFDGTPIAGEHADFRYDAWRTLSNVAVDHAWYAADPWQVEQSNRILGFLASQGASYPNQYALGGAPLSSDRSLGLQAMAAVAALAADREVGEPFVQALWDAAPPSGRWRYYDGLLYLLALLHVGGAFQGALPTS